MPPALILAGGVLAVSSASLLIRLAAEASPLVIGAYRLVIASLVVVPAALLLSRRTPAVHPSPFTLHTSLFLALLSGLFLAAHLGTWIASLSYTSVASSTVLVTTTPVILALLPERWRAEPLAPGAPVGVLVALAGTVLIAFGDAGLAPGMVVGDLLALLGAFTMVGHRLTGRRLLRQGLAPMSYLAIAYPAAALGLVCLALAAGRPLFGFQPQTNAALLGLGLGPQLIGHSALNWALTRVSAVGVSTAVTGEPVGATLLALLFLGEVPAPIQLAGGAIALAGVYLVLRREPLSREGQA